jgi:transcriptional regulator with XRE-family HTH domain
VPLLIGLFIRNEQRDLGLSQDELARRLNIPKGSISKLDRGLGGDWHLSRIIAELSVDTRSP